MYEFPEKRSQYEHAQATPALARLGHRFEYFENLTVAHGEKVWTATCVLCSVTVQGVVYEDVTALWGDVTVEDGGSVGERVQALGGRLTVLAGGRDGSTAGFNPSVQEFANSARRKKANLYYYPGQRSLPAEGVNLFIATVLLMLTCGGWLASAAFRERAAAAVRQPIWSTVFGIALLAFIPVLEAIAIVLLYILPPPFFLLFYGELTVYWLLLTIGLASLSLQVGSLARASSLAKHVIGALLIIAAMLIPVLGFFAMAAVMALALGAGARALLPNLKRRAV
jgi:hypothetical protein